MLVIGVFGVKSACSSTCAFKNQIKMAEQQTFHLTTTSLYNRDQFDPHCLLMMLSCVERFAGYERPMKTDKIVSISRWPFIAEIIIISYSTKMKK